MIGILEVGGATGVIESNTSPSKRCKGRMHDVQTSPPVREVDHCGVDTTRQSFDMVST
jgi:hypothetical protein